MGGRVYNQSPERRLRLMNEGLQNGGVLRGHGPDFILMANATGQYTQRVKCRRLFWMLLFAEFGELVKDL